MAEWLISVGIVAALVLLFFAWGYQAWAKENLARHRIETDQQLWKMQRKINEQRVRLAEDRHRDELVSQIDRWYSKRLY